MFEIGGCLIHSLSEIVYWIFLFAWIGPVVMYKNLVTRAHTLTIIVEISRVSATNNTWSHNCIVAGTPWNLAMNAGCLATHPVGMLNVIYDIH